jgi:ABC-type multidrug transport system permease subunit
MESTLEQLVKMLSEVAPKIWEIAVQQVYAQIIQTFVFLVVFTTIMFIVAYFINWIHRPENNLEETETKRESLRIDGQLYVFSLFLIWLSTFCVVIIKIVPKLMNPDWYAIEILRGLVR